MRALLTPEVAPRTGIVLFKPGPELLRLFQGRVVISTPTLDMVDLPSGRLNDGTQPLLDEPSLDSLLRSRACDSGCWWTKCACSLRPVIWLLSVGTARNMASP